MEEKGVVLGAFQMFHFRQMEYILAAKMRCKTLYIGIALPDFSADEPKEDETERQIKKERPFTYRERFEMIRDALLEFGIQRQEFEILPFSMTRPEQLFEYMPADAVYYMNVQTAAEEDVRQILVEKGAKTEVLWKGSSPGKRMTGMDVCRLIAEGEEWQQYVPKSAAEYMARNRIDERIRKIWNSPVRDFAPDETSVNYSS